MKADLMSGVRNCSGNKNGAKLTEQEKKLLKNAIRARIYRLTHRHEKTILNHEDWVSSSDSENISSSESDEDI
jgi:hypothetical protein